MNNFIKTLDKKQTAFFLVLGSYMFQGVTTLIYQVSWEQAMESIVGAALPTVSIIVSMFFLGMALGAYAFGRLSISPGGSDKLFVLNQICISLFGLIFVTTDGLKFLCYLSTQWEQYLPFIYALRLIILCAFLVATAFFVGGAFSLLMRGNILASLSSKAEKLYLVNLMGSVIGAILAGFILLPNLGLMKSTLLAVILNVFVVPIFLLAKNIYVLPVEDEVYEKSPNKERLAGLELESSRIGGSKVYLFLLIIVVAAFFNMFLELLFIRLFALFMGSGFAFSLVSAGQLFAIGCGSFVASSIYKQKRENFWSLFMLLYLVASVWLGIEFIFFTNLSDFIGIAKNLLINGLGFAPYLSFYIVYSTMVFILIFVPCFCLGANLPFYFQLRDLYPKLVPIKSSYAYAINLFASVFGCLSAGVFVFPILSNVFNHANSFAFVFTAISILFVGLLIYVFGVLRNKANKFIYLSAGAAAVGILVLCYWPLVKRPLLKTDGEMLFYKEGVNSTVSLIAQQNLISLQTDGQTEATLSLNQNLPASMSDESTQVLLGVLPNLFLLHKAKNIFLLGFGSGLTTEAILSDPEVENLNAAELEPAVLVAAKYLKHYTSDKRLKVNIIDGRNMLSMFDKSYDVIVSQPSEPWRSSSKYLYTLEFWQLAKSRLLNDGIFCQWLPLYGIDETNLLALCRTFASVFPNTFVIRNKNAAELILLGLNLGADEKNNEQRIMSMILNNVVRKSKLSQIKYRLVRLGFDNVSDLLAIVRLGPKDFHDWLFGDKSRVVGQFTRNSDDFPFVQYKTAFSIMCQGIKINMNIDKALPKSSTLALWSSEQLTNSKDDKLWDVSADLKRSRQLINGNDLPGAIYCLENILERQPNNYEARFVLGKILCYLNREEEGLTQIKWASKINPQDANPNLYVTLYYAFKADMRMTQNNLLLLEKKLYDSDIDYLAKKIHLGQSLNKHDDRIKMLMFRCHYPV